MWPFTRKKQPRSRSTRLAVAKSWTGQLVGWRAPGPHTVISGATRSGKSVASYVILSQLADRQDIAVVGIDPSGILLGPWAELDGTHPWYALGASPDDLDHAVDVLTALVNLMDRRIADLLVHGVDKITDFTPEHPAVIVVLEEYAGLLSALDAHDKKAAKTATALVGRLLREGAKVGISVLTILQRPEASILHDRAQYSRRVTFRLDNADSVRMVAESATDDATDRILTLSPGRALFLEAGEQEQFVTFPNMSYEQYRRAVRTHPHAMPESSVRHDQEEDQ